MRVVAAGNEQNVVGSSLNSLIATRCERCLLCVGKEHVQTAQCGKLRASVEHRNIQFPKGRTPIKWAITEVITYIITVLSLHNTGRGALLTMF
jgi:hypothetical protein